MNIFKNMLGVLLLTLVTSGMAQQDVHFSQFTASPLTVNPASAGLFDGSVRALANYRNQWSSITGESYKTSAVSFDAPLLTRMEVGRFGVGLNAYKDDAGDGQLSTLKYNLNLAYHINIGELGPVNYLSVGFQGGMIQRSIAANNLSWNNQWNGEGYDPTIFSVDETAVNSILAFDMATGVHWFYAPNNYSKFYGGLSMYHVASPDVSFYGGEEPLLKKYTLHGGLEIGRFGIQRATSTLNKVVYSPNFIYSKQGSNQYLNVGVDVKYKLTENSRYTNFQNEMSASFGMYYRYGDAAYLIARLNNWKGLTIGLSYDINISSVPGINGGLELVLGYMVDFNSNVRKRHNL